MESIPMELTLINYGREATHAHTNGLKASIEINHSDVCARIDRPVPMRGPVRPVTDKHTYVATCV
jgi:hypothetical protein